MTPEAFRGLRGRGPRASASRPSTRASSCARPSTRKRSTAAEGRAERLASGGPGRALGPAALPLVPEVRARGRRLGGARAAARRPRRARSGWRAARLGYVTGAVSSLGPPLLDGPRRHPVRRPGRCRSASSSWWPCAWPSPSSTPCSGGAMGRLVATFGPAGLLGAPARSGSALEYARTHTFFSFPWCLLGYSQHGRLPFIQVASVTAVYGVSFLVVRRLGAAGVRRRSSRAARRRRGGRSPRRALALGGGLGAGAAGRWRQPVAETGRITVGLVQGGIRQEDKWVPGERLGERRPPPAAHASRRPARARASSCGRSRPCRSSSTRTRRSPRLLRDAGAAAGDLPLLRQRRPRARAPARPSAASTSGRSCSTRRASSSRATTRSSSCRSASTCRCSRSSRSAGASRPSSSRRSRTSRPGRRPRPASWTATAIGGFICYEAIFPGLVRRFAAGRRRAAGQRHERRLVRDDLGAAPAPGDGRLPRGREPPLPGARGEHRDHRRRRPVGPRARARRALFDTTVLVREVPVRRRDDLLHPPRRRLRAGLRRAGPRPRGRDASARRPSTLEWTAEETPVERRPEAALRVAASEGRGHPRLSLTKPSSAPSSTALEKKMADPGFWGDQAAAQKVLQRRKRIEADLDLLKRLRGQEDDAKVLADWLRGGRGRRRGLRRRPRRARGDRSRRPSSRRCSAASTTAPTPSSRSTPGRAAPTARTGPRCCCACTCAGATAAASSATSPTSRRARRRASRARP